MKNDRITVRLPDELRAEVAKACAVTGLDEPTIIRECLKAFVEEVKTTGEIRLPFAVVPKSTRHKTPSFTSTAAPEPPLGSHRLNEGAITPVPVTYNKPTRKRIKEHRAHGTPLQK